MIIGYARVSSTGQSLDVQIEALTAGGCEKIYSEKRGGRTARRSAGTCAGARSAPGRRSASSHPAGPTGAVGWRSPPPGRADQRD
jgi:hypothetical protein